MEKPALAKVRLASCGAEYFGRNEASLYRASWRTIQKPVGNMALDVLRNSHGLNCISKAMLLPASDCTQLLLEVEGCWRLMHMTALERQTCDHTVISCPNTTADPSYGDKRTVLCALSYVVKRPIHNAKMSSGKTIVDVAVSNSSRCFHFCCDADKACRLEQRRSQLDHRIRQIHRWQLVV